MPACRTATSPRLSRASSSVSKFKPGGGGIRTFLVRVAQHAEDPGEFVENGADAPLDLMQCLPGGLGLLDEKMISEPGLNADHSDVVGDDETVLSANRRSRSTDTQATAARKTTIAATRARTVVRRSVRTATVYIAITTSTLKISTPSANSTLRPNPMTTTAAITRGHTRRPISDRQLNPAVISAGSAVTSPGAASGCLAATVTTVTTKDKTESRIRKRRSRIARSF